VTVVPGAQALGLHRAGPHGEVVVAVNAADRDLEVVLADAPGPWTQAFATAARHHDGVDPAGPHQQDGPVLTVPLTRRSVRVLVRAGTTERTHP
jgi:hypothetical protein